VGIEISNLYEWGAPAIVTEIVVEMITLGLEHVREQVRSWKARRTSR
jgi:hypothetical protein